MDPRLGRKVVAYVTRGTRLVVFREPAFPGAGLQVPGGCLEPGEDPDSGVLREAFEETGLTDLRIAELLGEGEHDLAPDFPVVQRRWFYHLVLEGPAPESWRHVERTPTIGTGPVEMDLWWHDLSAGSPELAAGLGAFLAELGRRLGLA